MADQPDFDNMTPEQIAEYQKQNCIFCKIIKGEIPSRKAYEDDKIISILDINPATKGHLLVMTKEHYSILPLIPFDTAAHMFRATKGLAAALKQAIVTNKTTVFIANGAVAGQQSPHFLYHLVPRENNDGLDNFIVPAKDYKEEEILQYLAPIRSRLDAMMKDYKAKAGRTEEPKQASQGLADPEIQKSMISESKTESFANKSFLKPAEAKSASINSHELAKFIEDNPKIKEMLLNNPEEFKRELEANPDMKKLFSNLDIAKLSAALGSIKKE
jgi:histidine triad (HIT) family protein